MKIGDKVRHKEHSQYGIGKVIEKDEVFNQTYYQILFKEADKSLRLAGDDLKPLFNPINMFKEKIVSSSEEFKLKVLAHQLETLYTGHQVVTPSNFKIKPLPHQILALNFVLEQLKPRCLLADEVGLGKTIEAALIFEELKMRGIVNKILIITPAGLTKQWKDEMKLKFSEDFYLMNKGKSKALFDLHGQEGNIWSEIDQVITSIDFLKPKKIHNDLGIRERERREEHNQRVYQACLETDWDMVIIDEAHKLTKYKSGRETARYKLGAALAEVTPIFLLLTATPHNGKPHVFKNLLKLIEPHLFYKIKDLKPDKVKKVTVRNKKRAAVDMEGNRLFKSRITSICEIDRKKEKYYNEVVLYEKIVNYVSEYYNYAKFEKDQTMIFLLMLYQRIVCSSSRAVLSSLNKRHNFLKRIDNLSKKTKDKDLGEFIELAGEEQLKLIENNQTLLKNSKALKEEIKILKECIETAKKCVKGKDDAKLKRLLEIIDEVKQREANPEVKMIIFTEFVKTQEYIIESLEALGYSTAYINGGLSLEEKIIAKNKFQEKAQFLVSTDAGGEGINLQFCFYMVNYDLPWNPMKLEQRIGRIDRIGQKEDVKIFNFVLKDTVEEHVRGILKKKLDLIKEQFGEDKLRDILSTLQEEFNFDKIYFDAVIKREKEAEKLENIAQDMYQQAQEILEEDELLIPFNEKNNIEQKEKRLLNELPVKIKKFMDLFLQRQNNQLVKYSNKEDIYYFKNNFKTDKYGKRFSKVIFKPKKGVDSEEAELFSLRNDYIRDVLAEVKNKGKVASLIINDKRFANTTGLLSYWELLIENNYEFSNRYYLAIFIENNGRYNSRISRCFDKIINLDFKQGKSLSELNNIDELYQTAKEYAEKRGEDLFYEEKLNWEEKANDKINQIESFYKEKLKAITEIKIDNIRESRKKKAKKELKSERKKLKEKAKLYPKLSCEQLAYIKFGGQG